MIEVHHKSILKLYYCPQIVLCTLYHKLKMLFNPLYPQVMTKRRKWKQMW